MKMLNISYINFGLDVYNAHKKKKIKSPFVNILRKNYLPSFPKTQTIKLQPIKHTHKKRLVKTVFVTTC